jgi:protein-S-isoprenylcysteine O-methyltransferase Ste14
MKLLYIKSVTGFFLFMVQYTSLAYLFFSGALYPREWFLWPPYLAGLVLGILAILAMGLGNLNAGPDILPSGKLVTSGPYRLIRHPMYTAILFVFIPLVITSYSHIRLLIFVILSLNLFLKIHYEERRMNQRFWEYSEYSSGTWRLLPYVY